MSIYTEIFEEIEKARCPCREGPYGLYDYSEYGGNRVIRDYTDPHSVLWGSVVFMTQDENEAQAEYDRLTAEFIGRAAYQAVIKRIDING